MLGYAIRSVLAQDFEDFELVVVGDGCAPETAELVATFSDARIRWMDLPKAPGFGYANRNVALAQTSGDLIAFLGHDNVYLPDHLSRMARHFTRDTVQFAYSRPLWIDDAGVVMPSYVNLQHPVARRRFLTVANVLPASTVVYRRSAMDRAGMWPEDIDRNGDWDLWKRILTEFDSGPNLIHEREPTMLHFRADWRDPGRWMPPSMSYVAAMHSAGVYWPDGLDLNLDPDGALPQAQVWDRLEKDSTGVAQRLRHGTRLLQDAMAYNVTLDGNFSR